MSQPGFFIGQSFLGQDTFLRTPPNIKRIEAVREARKRIDAAFDAMVAADMGEAHTDAPETARTEYEAAVEAMNNLTVLFRRESA